MAYTRPCAFHLQNLSRLNVPMHGIVLQMLVFILNNYGRFSVLCVTVLLNYLTDFSIRVSQSCFFLGGGGGGRGRGLDLALSLTCYCKLLLIVFLQQLYYENSIIFFHVCCFTV